jgi:hypothetical protein
MMSAILDDREEEWMIVNVTWQLGLQVTGNVGHAQK